MVNFVSQSLLPNIKWQCANFSLCKDPTQTVPILYLIKQGTIKDFGVETITSQELIDKIITVHGTQAAGAASQPSVHMTNATNQQQQQQQEQSTSTSEQPISVSPPPNSTAVTADENKKEK